MSKDKKPKEIHVENLIIHAKNVEIIDEHQEREQQEREPRRNPWDFFWGRPMTAEGESMPADANIEGETVEVKEGE